MADNKKDSSLGVREFEEIKFCFRVEAGEWRTLRVLKGDVSVVLVTFTGRMNIEASDVLRLEEFFEKLWGEGIRFEYI